jgi:hypothetical protein
MLEKRGTSIELKYVRKKSFVKIKNKKREGKRIKYRRRDEKIILFKKNK